MIQTQNHDTLRCGFCKIKAKFSNFWGGIDRRIDWPRCKDHFDTNLAVQGGRSWEIEPGRVTVPQGDPFPFSFFLSFPLLALISYWPIPSLFLSDFLLFFSSQPHMWLLIKAPTNLEPSRLTTNLPFCP